MSKATHGELVSHIGVRTYSLKTMEKTSKIKAFPCQNSGRYALS